MNEKFPSLRQKSPEELQAQASAYISNLEKSKRESKFTEALERLSRGEEVDISEFSDSERADYLLFLRASKGLRGEVIKYRTEIIEAYKDFAPLVEAVMKEEINTNHPNYLGEGGSSRAFFIEKDGKKYAVRISRSFQQMGISSVNSYITKLAFGRSVPHLEQVIAASFEEGVTISEIMAGSEVGRMTVEQINKIKDSQISDLIDTFIIAHSRGIKIDPKPSNIFYDDSEGYGIIDYQEANPQHRDKRSIVEMLAEIPMIIRNQGFYGNPNNSRTLNNEQDYLEVLEYHRANLVVLKKFRDIVSTKLGGDDLRFVLNSLDKQIHILEEIVQNYSSPQWIKDELEKHRKNKEFKITPVQGLDL